MSIDGYTDAELASTLTATEINFGCDELRVVRCACGREQLCSGYDHAAAGVTFDELLSIGWRLARMGGAPVWFCPFIELRKLEGFEDCALAGLLVRRTS